MLQRSLVKINSFYDNQSIKWIPQPIKEHNFPGNPKFFPFYILCEAITVALISTKIFCKKTVKESPFQLQEAISLSCSPKSKSWNTLRKKKPLQKDFKMKWFKDFFLAVNDSQETEVGFLNFKKQWKWRIIWFG